MKKAHDLRDMARGLESPGNEKSEELMNLRVQLPCASSTIRCACATGARSGAPHDVLNQKKGAGAPLGRGARAEPGRQDDGRTPNAT